MKRSVVASLISSCLVIATVTVIALDGPWRTGLDDEPESVADVRDLYYFESVAEMTATADLVVRATVASVQPGRSLGEGPGTIRLREVHLTPVKVLFRKSDTPIGQVVRLDEEGWDAKGQGYMIAGLPWSEPGHEAVYFLTYLPSTDTFRYVSSQGKVMIQPTLNIPSAGGPLAAEISSRSLTELEASIAKTGQDFEAGRIQPVPSFVEATP